MQTKKSRGQKTKTGAFEVEYGRALKYYRDRSNKSQEEMAKHLNVSLQQYQKYETGKNKISIATEKEIAKFLEFTRFEFVEKIEKLIKI